LQELRSLIDEGENSGKLATWSVDDFLKKLNKKRMAKTFKLRPKAEEDLIEITTVKKSPDALSISKERLSKLKARKGEGIARDFFRIRVMFFRHMWAQTFGYAHTMAMIHVLISIELTRQHHQAR